MLTFLLIKLDWEWSSFSNDYFLCLFQAHVTLSPTMYTVPRRGTVQVTLYNPMRTVVKMFVINYDLSNLPANSQTFIRQKIFFMPLGKSDRDPSARKWLRYLIHLRFGSSPSGDKVYLHKDIRMIVLQKSDVDTAVGLSSVTGGVAACNDKMPGDSSMTYELRSFTYFADGSMGKWIRKSVLVEFRIDVALTILRASRKTVGIRQFPCIFVWFSIPRMVS